MNIKKATRNQFLHSVIILLKTYQINATINEEREDISIETGFLTTCDFEVLSLIINNGKSNSTPVNIHYSAINEKISIFFKQ